VVVAIIYIVGLAACESAHARRIVNKRAPRLAKRQSAAERKSSGNNDARAFVRAFSNCNSLAN
jgi:hypothetical protein